MRRGVVHVDGSASSRVSPSLFLTPLQLFVFSWLFRTDLVQPLAKFLSSFYGLKGQLRYVADDGSVLSISSEAGTHQGDVWSPALFAASIHPTLCEVLDYWPNVVAVLWADNIFFIGPLREAAFAARQARNALRPLGLQLNEDETKAYVPRATDVSMLKHMLEGVSDFPIQPVMNGINILGVPFGTAKYTEQETAKIVDKIQNDIPKIAVLRDGLMHFQMLRFCENTRFAHVCRALPVALVDKAARRVDSIIMNAFAEYCGWPDATADMLDEAHESKYQTARTVVRGALREGGFGLTSVRDICAPAFYHAAAHSLRWICNHESLTNLLQWDLSLPPRQLRNDFINEFLDVEHELLTSGCQRPEDVSLRPTGATALLPRWVHLISPRPDDTFFPIPPQRVIVRTFLAVRRPFTAPDHANQYPFMFHRKLQTIRDHTSSPLKDKLGFSRQQLKTASITYNPMAFLMAIPTTKWQLFPKHLFQHWVRLALDLPFEDCAVNCPFCGEPQDTTGHHRATCKKTASRAWTRGHDHVIEAIAAMLAISGLPYTTREAQIPRHSDSAKRGDIDVNCTIGHFEKLVLDFSLVHPRNGASQKYPAGRWKPDSVAQASTRKNAKHAIPYEQGNLAFLSLTADTYGKLSDDFIRFIWMLANQASTNSRLSQPQSSGASPDPHEFVTQRGSYFSRMRVQLGAALAKAAAVRFVRDGVDDGLPVHVHWDNPVAGGPLPPPDLPLYHTPS